MMQNKVLKLGVVGLGRAGWDIHIKAVRDRADFKVTAVTDPAADRCKQAADELGATVYSDLTAMLEQSDMDVVVIASPSDRHAPDTLEAFKAGKHVVAEKPMAIELDDADAMIEASKQAGKRLFVHHQRRFSREYTHLEQIIQSGIIGKLFHVRCYVQQFARRNDWQTLRKYGGGELNNTATHYLDMTLPLLGGKVVKLMSDMKQVASAGDVEDHVKVLLKAESGVTADLEISRAEVVLPNGLPRWILCGTAGTLTCDGRTSVVQYFDPAQAGPLSVQEGPAQNRSYTNDDELPWQKKEMDAQGPDVGDFYDNVHAVLCEEAPQRITPESVREVMRVVDWIRRDSGA